MSKCSPKIKPSLWDHMTNIRIVSPSGHLSKYPCQCPIMGIEGSVVLMAQSIVKMSRVTCVKLFEHARFLQRFVVMSWFRLLDHHM